MKIFCAQWEREISDPDDVLLEAEYRKQELKEEQERKKPKQRNPALKEDRYPIGVLQVGAPFYFIGKITSYSKKLWQGNLFVGGQFLKACQEFFKRISLSGVQEL